MEQIRKRFTAEQVKALLEGYRQGILDRAAIEEFLGIGKTRFFVACPPKKESSYNVSKIGQKRPF